MNVLRAYANYDKQIGYTQGMNFIVAAIYMSIIPKNYKNIEHSFGKTAPNIERITFWILIHICFEKN
jgi:hypothetical protein